MSSKRAYHNVLGFIRDLAHALEWCDRDDEALQVVRRIATLIDTALEAFYAELDDAEDSPGGESDSDLDLRDREHGSEVVRASEGHGAMQHPAVAQPSGLGSPMERTRDLARAAVQPQRPADSVVRTRVETARRVIGGGDAS